MSDNTNAASEREMIDAFEAQYGAKWEENAIHTQRLWRDAWQAARQPLPYVESKFNEWWDSDRLTKTNPFEGDTPIFWAWEGWQAARRTTPDRECEWKCDDIDNGIWESACGETWSFIDGGPVENRMLFCHRCGGKLKTAPHNRPRPFGRYRT